MQFEKFATEQRVKFGNKRFQPGQFDFKSEEDPHVKDQKSLNKKSIRKAKRGKNGISTDLIETLMKKNKLLDQHDFCIQNNYLSE